MLDRRSFLMGSTALLAMSPDLGRATQISRRATVRGAAAPIEIIDDAMGIPHIRANTKRDAFFGQGYVVARDRLFQIDLGRRGDMGRMAEAFGPGFAELDRRARLFHYRGDIAAELADIPAEVLECAQGYVDGVNARMAEVEANPALLPAEYRILKLKPMRWDITDMVIARGASSGNMTDEVRRARLHAMGLAHLDALIAPLRPAWTLTVPEGLDTSAVSEADLGILLAGRGGAPFSTSTPAANPDDPDQGPDDDAIERGNAGSNAWTVDGSRTATGRPILANDPHLGIGGFGPRHVSHLTAPGLDVIGGGAPGLPGIMQGHTDRFAFGRTNFHIDGDDLFILETHPDDPMRYRHDGEWKRFTVHRDTIKVAGEADRVAEQLYSVHGPVVARDPARRRASAVASIDYRPGGCGWFAMIAINLSRDWDGLKSAFRIHPSPTNFHYADIDGNTGWQVIGHAPVRKRGDGLMPVPGDGSYDWTERIMYDRLPSSYNPAPGWFASANQNNIPADYPFKANPLAFSFRDPYRYERIASVLEVQDKHSIADSVTLLHDTYSTPARQLQSLLPKTADGDAGLALAMLRDWDGRIEGDSGAAALYQILWRELGNRLRGLIVPERARELVDSLSPSVVLGLIAHPDTRLGAEPVKARDTLLLTALGTAWFSAKRLMGDDPATWRWATIHRVRIAHPLSSIPAIAKAFPPIEGEGTGGDSYTPMARWIPSSSWRVSGGASYLMVCDVGAWDNSVFLMLPGQSADPNSPHYRDFYRPWVNEQMQPLLFSRARVDAAAKSRTTLAPAS